MIGRIPVCTIAPDGSRPVRCRKASPAVVVPNTSSGMRPSPSVDGSLTDRVPAPIVT
jgi:hypothetical protein